MVTAYNYMFRPLTGHHPLPTANYIPGYYYSLVHPNFTYLFSSSLFNLFIKYTIRWTRSRHQIEVTLYIVQSSALFVRCTTWWWPVRGPKHV